MPTLRIGISSCLCGQPVRYDGQHKLSQNLLDQLEPHATLVPLCPEVAIGMGAPRPPIHLTDNINKPVVRQVENPSRTFTAPLADYARRIAEEARLDGYICKARSPSCGYLSSPVFIQGIEQPTTVSGVYIATLVDSLPGLPVVDETVVDRPGALEEFIERCIDYRENRQATRRPDGST